MFFCLGVWLVLFGIVLPMFQLCHVALFSQKLPVQILFLSGARFGRNFRERTFDFLSWCPIGVFWYCFANVFVLLCGVVLPKAPEKIIFLSGSRFGRNFRERTFGFCLGVRLVFFGIVLPMF